jgi:hypothetical protein
VTRSRHLLAACALLGAMALPFLRGAIYADDGEQD